MTHFSEKEPIQNLLARREDALLKEALFVTAQKEIPYGTMFTCEATKDSGRFTVYSSKKRGLTLTDISKNDVSRRALSILRNETDVPFEAKAGTDEAGKGDLFGPLTCTAFYVGSPETARTLRRLGIQDSKRISDKKIEVLAEEIMYRWPRSFATISPGMEKYNELYAKTGNLNILLGWMHGRALLDLSQKLARDGITLHRAVADKFGPTRHITSSARALSPIAITAVTQGEEKEIAIAAASVIARYSFIRSLKRLSSTYNINFPLGCAERVKAPAEEFIRTYGRENLDKVCKIHFKTVQQLKG